MIKLCFKSTLMSIILLNIAFIEALSFSGQMLHNRIEQALYGF